MASKFQSVTKADGSIEYVYQYTDPTTGQRGKRFRGTLAACQVFEAKLRTARQELRHKLTTREAARASLPGGVDETHTRLRVIWDRYLSTLPKRARGTAESVWKHHIDLPDEKGAVPLGDRVPLDLNAEVMGTWAARLKETGGRDDMGRAPKTIMNAYSYLCAALRKILGIEKLPWGKWRPYGRGKVDAKNPREYTATFEELLSLVAEARKIDAKKWSKGRYADLSIATVIGSLAFLRNAELAGLGWDDCEIDRDPPRITSRHQAPRGWKKDFPAAKRSMVPPKNGKVHRQILHVSAWYALLEQREQLRRLGWYRDDGPVFPSARTGTWTTTGRAIIPDQIRKAARAAGLPNIAAWCAHSLRHGGASLELVAQGGDRKATMARTGHQDPAVFDGYTHQLGRGVPRSRLPEVPRALFSPAVDGAIAVPLLPPRAHATTDPWGLAPEPGDMRATFSIEVEAAVEREKESRRMLRKESERSFVELAREWLEAGERGTTANGKPIPRPHAVTEQSRRRGANAYQKAKYAGKPVQECRRAYARAVHAVLGKWTAVLRTEREGRLPPRDPPSLTV